ncbi:hypothetical protein [Sediminibacterium soli]|uniref:hypothetical protein n=1 Tax=Sediminibacterium soli TaxID=2698829 RepID=UPI00137A084D|nr:hypothetical protein [Sediminibacterium soli]NCI47533.1 hypothetical protein [Sediminibacterium soli]
MTTISKFPITKSDTLNRSINRAVRILVNNMRAGVEINTVLDNNGKFKWLRGINEMLTSFISGYRAKVISGSLLSNLVKAYDDAMRLDINGRSILGVVRDNPMEVGQILVDNYALQGNQGIVPGKDILVLKACQRDPENLMRILKKYPDNRYADSLLILAAFRDQEELYNYASDSHSALGKRIHSINHPLVKTIVKMSQLKTGRMYFPFLDDIYNGKISMDSITPKLEKDSSEYYALLVKTRIGYAKRMQNGDTPMAAKALVNKLHTKAIELYINEINALHDVSNLNVRFKKLEGLSPEELYYVAVLGEEEIYTSSFVSGVYPRIISRLGKSRSDTLLQLVHNDYYKKFLKMCAAYNTLDNFLDKMDKSTSQTYMKGFVSGLENTRTLEDAVDVADSYGSIYNKDLRKLILDQVQIKLAENQQKKNKRGTVIYNLLNTIFLSMDSSNHIDVAAQLGINPIYIMPNQLLRDTSKRIIVQQFFYGDKDGRTYYDAFLAQFRNANWRITRKPQWVEVQSVKGAPVTIYSNLPLDEKQDLDAESQDKLIAYLEDKGLEPTVVIHRGHSYYLNSTISKLPSSGKVVLVGSCGGYQMLNKVLEICPGAHIISSKQVGAGIINQGLINLMTEQLRQGKDLNWPAIWRTLGGKFNGGIEEKFDDYVPPYKNLGAIFITAYNNAQ